MSKHVAVLMGGWSAEREVSLRSGKYCAEAVERLGHRVTQIDVGRDIATVLASLKPDVALNVLHGRPGEDGYTERVLASWGVDGHNSHTNVCSSGGRAGFQFWMGIDRPSPDHEHAKVIFLISAHLEAGHYFNPHAQRITEARQNGAKVIVVDTRLSNTASHADHWLSPHPGSEAAINRGT